MNGIEFLETIYHGASEQFTYIWTRDNENKEKRVTSFSVKDLRSLLKVAKNMNQRMLNVSYSMGLLDHQLGTYERAKDVDIVAIPCLWCDIDVKSKVHGQKEKLAPDIKTARAFLPPELPPSIVVNSGYGIHGYWILETLFDIKNETDRRRAKKMLEHLQAIIRARAGEYFIDNTSDLSRMLRLPETVNWKSKNRSNSPICRVIENSNIFYSVESIEGTLDQLIQKITPITENPREISKNQRDLVNSRQNPEFVRSQITAQALFEKCAFCKHCIDHIDSLSHDEFKHFFPTLLRAQDGETLALDICRRRFSDSFDITKSINQIASFKKMTPINCNTIAMFHQSCDPSSCSVVKANKKSPVAILNSPAVNKDLSTIYVTDIFQDSPDSFAKIKIPPEFDITQSHITDLRGKKPKVIINSPVIVSGVFVSATSDFPLYYQISIWYNLKWYACRVKPQCLSDSRSMINTLSAYGILISSKNTGFASDFFNTFIEYNRENLPKFPIYEKLGWHGFDFILPSLNDGSYCINDPSSNEQIQIHGSRDISIDLLRKISKYPYARLILDVNLAAPLLELVNCRNFILDLACKSHQGKTTAMLFANSIWASPSWMVHFNATTNAVGEFGATRNSLPTNANEWQMTDARNRDSIADQIVHRFSEGTGRLRLNRDGSPRSAKSWRGILVITSEEKLTSDYAFQGVKSRCLEIIADTVIGFVDSSGKSVINHDLCKEIHDKTQDHYGHLGAEFIQKLREEFAEDPDFKGLKELASGFFDLAMNVQKERILSSYADYLAVIACAHYKAQQYFLKQTKSEAMLSTIEFLRFFANQAPTENSLLDAERAKSVIIDWIHSYIAHFIRTKTSMIQKPGMEVNLSAENMEIRDPCYGFFVDDEIYVFPQILKDSLKKYGFNGEKIIREWIETNAIIAQTGQSSRHLGVLKKNPMDGKRVRVIGLKFFNEIENTPEPNDSSDDENDIPPEQIPF